MPLPTDERIIALSNDLIQQFDSMFGLNPGFRPAHAKGRMLTGKFTPTPAAASLTAHPKASAFVQPPNPTPSSLARESYFGVTAVRFTNQNGASRYGRYRILPEAGVDHLPDDVAAAKSPTFLFDELAERIARGP